MIGQKFDRLTVIADLGMRQHGFSTRTRRMVLCQCDCGKEITVRLDHAQSGHTQSCGCFNREQVGKASKGINRSKVSVGEIYGRLTVVARLKNSKRGDAVYACECECGKSACIKGVSLSSKIRTQCHSCSSKAHLDRVHAQLTKPFGDAACRAAYVQTKRYCADKRGYAWEISFDDWKRLTTLPCHYCGCPPSNLARGGYGRNGEYRYNGLDRVDNGVGYTLNNIVPCCKRCNHAKSDQTLVEFLSWVHRVSEHSTKM